MDYIFGYGSLICAESRSRTGVTGSAYAARVKGIKRGWVVPVEDGHTVLGAVKDSDAICNGVIFEVNDENLMKFDHREKEYSRLQLNIQNIDTTMELDSQSRVWTYVGDEFRPPCQKLPIAQSYLDVIINGSLTFGEDFLREFVKTTDYWLHFLNDRSNPVYPRAMTRTDHHQHFDTLLESLLGAFNPLPHKTE